MKGLPYQTKFIRAYLGCFGCRSKNNFRFRSLATRGFLGLLAAGCRINISILTLGLGILGKLLLSWTMLCRECHTLMSITLLMSQHITNPLFRTASPESLQHSKCYIRSIVMLTFSQLEPRTARGETQTSCN